MAQECICSEPHDFAGSNLAEQQGTCISWRAVTPFSLSITWLQEDVSWKDFLLEKQCFQYVLSCLMYVLFQSEKLENLTRAQLFKLTETSPCQLGPAEPLYVDRTVQVPLSPLTAPTDEQGLPKAQDLAS